MRLPGTIDVVVVGAGPGGCAAAWRLAKAGVRVLLLDREIFPRPKTCGDGLSPRALAVIEAMQATADLGSPPPIDSLTAVDLEDGSVIRGPVPGPGRVGAVVPRLVLDDALRSAAERAGALFVGQTEVRGLVRKGDRVVGAAAVGPLGAVEVRARVTVVAEGAAGRLARVVRPALRRPRAGAAVRQYVRVPGGSDPAFRLFVPLRSEGEPVCGYGWVFPVSGDVANVGVGRFLPEQGLEPSRLHGLFAQFLSTLARRDPAFARARPCGRLEGGLVPTGLRVDEVGVDGAVLVGDAAAVANPFTGEGIAHALESGCAAGDAILEHLGAGSPLPEVYRRRLADAFPGASTWAELLPWLSARGGIRGRELWELVAGRVGALGVAARRVVLEERPGTRNDDPGGEPAWALADRVVAGRHPILSELLRATRALAGEAASGHLATYRSLVGNAEPGSEAALALLSMIGVLANAVVDRPSTPEGEAASRQASWASQALGIGMADLLVAETFRLLATVPAPVASRIASVARGRFHTALAGALRARSP